MFSDRPPVELDVSVVIPTHNRAHTIDRAIRSVLAQTDVNVEVIVVDDGSTDDTSAVIEGIADGRVRVFKLQHSHGAPFARNFGVERARAKWIAFQDSDDLWMPQKLSRQMEAARHNADVGLVYCSLVRVYADFVDLVPGKHLTQRKDSLLAKLARESFISTQTILVKREVFDDVGGFDLVLKRFQDWDFVTRVALRQVPVAVVTEPLAVAFETPGNLTSFPMKAVDARELMFKKYPELSIIYPKAIAHGHFICASLSLKAGDYRRSLGHICRALRLNCTNVTYLLFGCKLGAVSLLRLVRERKDQEAKRL